jgi:DNA-binding transcriptional regulator LsrR (DeoR family)
VETEVEDRLTLLAAVADLYYLENQSQAKIARKFGYSRSAISRLLTEARHKGVVEIHVNYPVRRSKELERELRQRFGLATAIVAERGRSDYREMLRNLGKLGAFHLLEMLSDTATLGVSWGTAIYEVANALPRRYMPDVKVVQMIGSGFGNPDVDGSGIGRAIADRLNSHHFALGAPLIARDELARDLFLREPNISVFLLLSLYADVALVGIGSVELGLSSLLRAGYLNEEEILAIKASGAVGHICAQHYDEQGQILDYEINRRVIGVDLRKLTTSGCKVIGVAGGKVKAPAILGALRGKFLYTLVTDSNAAEAILELDQQLP